jgi:hypothetical protein
VSTYSVGSLLYWCILFCIGVYYAIVSYHLVLLCSGTYLLVMHLTILRILTFRFGTRYIRICTAISAVQIWMYSVPDRNVEILRIVRCITRRYREVCTATEQYRVVWYYSIVRTNTALCHTKYVQSLYSEVDQVAGPQRQCAAGITLY